MGSKGALQRDGLRVRKAISLAIDVGDLVADRLRKVRDLLDDLSVRISLLSLSFKWPERGILRRDDQLAAIKEA